MDRGELSVRFALSDIPAASRADAALVPKTCCEGLARPILAARMGRHGANPDEARHHERGVRTARLRPLCRSGCSDDWTPAAEIRQRDATRLLSPQSLDRRAYLG